MITAKIFKSFLLCMAFLCSICAYSKSNNTKRDYIDIEAKYYMGEYSDCSKVGDSIYYVENIYDAMIMSYSSLANFNLAFAEREFDIHDNTYSANYYRATMKAGDALDYIISHFRSNQDQEISEKTLPEKLQSYSLAMLCSRILEIPRYKQFVKYIHNNIVPLKESLSQKYCVEKLQISYFEIIYAMDHEQEDYVYESLLPAFENEVSMLQSLEPVQKAHIANIYVQLSDYLNYKVMDTEKESQRLRDMAINTMIHSRDYSLYSKKTVGKSLFRLTDWKQLKKELKSDEVALLFFTYSRRGDSWNYMWTISSKSLCPSLAYGGHSYWSEAQAMSSQINLDDYKQVFAIGTNSMKFTDFSNDKRIVRLHTLSEIANRKISYNNGNVDAIGNLKYSSVVDAEASEEKGILRNLGKIGEFASAEREMNSLKNIFGDKLKIYQGDAVSRSTFHNFEKGVSILHISTHGTFSRQLLNKYNDENSDLGATGDNIFKSCGLMLSGYNDNKDANFISAFEIKNLDLSDIDFVFISACESGAGQVLTIGDYSLAEAFHVAGVKNIVAVVDPISDDVATNFAEVLYKEIKSGKSYHDAFYTAKYMICPHDRILLFE